MASNVFLEYEKSKKQKEEEYCIKRLRKLEDRRNVAEASIHRSVAGCILLPAVVGILTGLIIGLCSFLPMLGRGTVFWAHENRFKYRIIGILIGVLGLGMLLIVYLLYKKARTGEKRRAEANQIPLIDTPGERATKNAQRHHTARFKTGLTKTFYSISDVSFLSDNNPDTDSEDSSFIVYYEAELNRNFKTKRKTFHHGKTLFKNTKPIYFNITQELYDEARNAGIIMSSDQDDPNDIVEPNLPLIPPQQGIASGESGTAATLTNISYCSIRDDENPPECDAIVVHDVLNTSDPIDGGDMDIVISKAEADFIKPTRAITVDQEDGLLIHESDQEFSNEIENSDSTRIEEVKMVSGRNSTKHEAGNSFSVDSPKEGVTNSKKKTKATVRPKILKSKQYSEDQSQGSYSEDFEDLSGSETDQEQSNITSLWDATLLDFNRESDASHEVMDVDSIYDWFENSTDPSFMDTMQCSTECSLKKVSSCSICNDPNPGTDCKLSESVKELFQNIAEVRQQNQVLTGSGVPNTKTGDDFVKSHAKEQAVPSFNGDDNELEAFSLFGNSIKTVIKKTSKKKEEYCPFLNSEDVEGSDGEIQTILGTKHMKIKKNKLNTQKELLAQTIDSSDEENMRLPLKRIYQDMKTEEKLNDRSSYSGGQHSHRLEVDNLSKVKKQKTKDFLQPEYTHGGVTEIKSFSLDKVTVDQRQTRSEEEISKKNLPVRKIGGTSLELFKQTEKNRLPLQNPYDKQFPLQLDNRKDRCKDNLKTKEVICSRVRKKVTSKEILTNDDMEIDNVGCTELNGVLLSDDQTKMDCVKNDYLYIQCDSQDTVCLEDREIIGANNDNNTDEERRFGRKRKTDSEDTVYNDEGVVVGTNNDNNKDKKKKMQIKQETDSGEYSLEVDFSVKELEEQEDDSDISTKREESRTRGLGCCPMPSPRVKKPESTSKSRSWISPHKVSDKSPKKKKTPFWKLCLAKQDSGSSMTEESYDPVEEDQPGSCHHLCGVNRSGSWLVDTGEHNKLRYCYLPSSEVDIDKTLLKLKMEEERKRCLLTPGTRVDLDEELLGIKREQELERCKEFEGTAVDILEGMTRDEILSTGRVRSDGYRPSSAVDSFRYYAIPDQSSAEKKDVYAPKSDKSFASKKESKSEESMPRLAESSSKFNGARKKTGTFGKLANVFKRKHTKLSEDTLAGKKSPINIERPLSPGGRMSPDRPMSPGGRRSPGGRMSPDRPMSPGGRRSPGRSKSSERPMSPGGRILDRPMSPGGRRSPGGYISPFGSRSPVPMITSESRILNDVNEEDIEPNSFSTESSRSQINEEVMKPGDYIVECSCKCEPCDWSSPVDDPTRLLVSGNSVTESMNYIIPELKVEKEETSSLREASISPVSGYSIHSPISIMASPIPPTILEEEEEDLEEEEEEAELKFVEEEDEEEEEIEPEEEEIGDIEDVTEKDDDDVLEIENDTTPFNGRESLHHSLLDEPIPEEGSVYSSGSDDIITGGITIATQVSFSDDDGEKDMSIQVSFPSASSSEKDMSLHISMFATELDGVEALNDIMTLSHEQKQYGQTIPGMSADEVTRSEFPVEIKSGEAAKSSILEASTSSGIYSKYKENNEDLHLGTGSMVGSPASGGLNDLGRNVTPPVRHMVDVATQESISSLENQSRGSSQSLLSHLAEVSRSVIDKVFSRSHVDTGEANSQSSKEVPLMESYAATPISDLVSMVTGRPMSRESQAGSVRDEELSPRSSRDRDFHRQSSSRPRRQRSTSSHRLPLSSPTPQETELMSSKENSQSDSLVTEPSDDIVEDKNKPLLQNNGMKKSSASIVPQREESESKVTVQDTKPISQVRSREMTEQVSTSKEQIIKRSVEQIKEIPSAASVAPQGERSSSKVTLFDSKQSLKMSEPKSDSKEQMIKRSVEQIMEEPSASSIIPQGERTTSKVLLQESKQSSVNEKYSLAMYASKSDSKEPVIKRSVEQIMEQPSASSIIPQGERTTSKVLLQESKQSSINEKYSLAMYASKSDLKEPVIKKQSSINEKYSLAMYASNSDLKEPVIKRSVEQIKEVPSVASRTPQGERSSSLISVQKKESADSKAISGFKSKQNETLDELEETQAFKQENLDDLEGKSPETMLLKEPGSVEDVLATDNFGVSSIHSKHLASIGSTENIDGGKSHRSQENTSILTSHSREQRGAVNGASSQKENSVMSLLSKISIPSLMGSDTNVQKDKKSAISVFSPDNRSIRSDRGTMSVPSEDKRNVMNVPAYDAGSAMSVPGQNKSSAISVDTFDRRSATSVHSQDGKSAHDSASISKDGRRAMNVHTQDGRSTMSFQSQDGISPMSVHSKDGRSPVSLHSQDRRSTMSVHSQDRISPMNDNSQDGRIPMSVLFQDRRSIMSVHSQDGVSPMSVHSQDRRSIMSVHSQDGVSPMSFLSQDGRSAMSFHSQDMAYSTNIPSNEGRTSTSPIYDEDDNSVLSISPDMAQQGRIPFDTEDDTFVMSNSPDMPQGRTMAPQDGRTSTNSFGSEDNITIVSFSPDMAQGRYMAPQDGTEDDISVGSISPDVIRDRNIAQQDGRESTSSLATEGDTSIMSISPDMARPRVIPKIIPSIPSIDGRRSAQSPAYKEDVFSEQDEISDMAHPDLASQYGRGESSHPGDNRESVTSIQSRVFRTLSATRKDSIQKYERERIATFYPSLQNYGYQPTEDRAANIPTRQLNSEYSESLQRLEDENVAKFYLSENRSYQQKQESVRIESYLQDGKQETLKRASEERYQKRIVKSEANQKTTSIDMVSPMQQQTNSIPTNYMQQGRSSDIRYSPIVRPMISTMKPEGKEATNFKVDSLIDGASAFKRDSINRRSLPHRMYRPNRNLEEEKAQKRVFGKADKDSMRVIQSAPATPRLKRAGSSPSSPRIFDHAYSPEKSFSYMERLSPIPTNICHPNPDVFEQYKSKPPWPKPQKSKDKCKSANVCGHSNKTLLEEQENWNLDDSDCSVAAGSSLGQRRKSELNYNVSASEGRENFPDELQDSKPVLEVNQPVIGKPPSSRISFKKELAVVQGQKIKVKSEKSQRIGQSLALPTHYFHRLSHIHQKENKGEVDYLYEISKDLTKDFIKNGNTQRLKAQTNSPDLGKTAEKTTAHKRSLKLDCSLKKCRINENRDSTPKADSQLKSSNFIDENEASRPSSYQLNDFYKNHPTSLGSLTGQSDKFMGYDDLQNKYVMVKGSLEFSPLPDEAHLKQSPATSIRQDIHREILDSYRNKDIPSKSDNCTQFDQSPNFGEENYLNQRHEQSWSRDNDDVHKQRSGARHGSYPTSNKDYALKPHEEKKRHSVPLGVDGRLSRSSVADPLVLGSQDDPLSGKKFSNQQKYQNSCQQNDVFTNKRDHESEEKYYTPTNLINRIPSRDSSNGETFRVDKGTQYDDQSNPYPRNYRSLYYDSKEDILDPDSNEMDEYFLRDHRRSPRNSSLESPHNQGRDNRYTEQKSKDQRIEYSERKSQDPDYQYAKRGSPESDPSISARETQAPLKNNHWYTARETPIDQRTEHRYSREESPRDYKAELRHSGQGSPRDYGIEHRHSSYNSPRDQSSNERYSGRQSPLVSRSEHRYSGIQESKENQESEAGHRESRHQRNKNIQTSGPLTPLPSAPRSPITQRKITLEQETIELIKRLNDIARIQKIEKLELFKRSKKEKHHEAKAQRSISVGTAIEEKHFKNEKLKAIPTRKESEKINFLKHARSKSSNCLYDQIFENLDLDISLSSDSVSIASEDSTSSSDLSENIENLLNEDITIETDNKKKKAVERKIQRSKSRERQHKSTSIEEEIFHENSKHYVDHEERDRDKSKILRKGNIESVKITKPLRKSSPEIGPVRDNYQQITSRHKRSSPSLVKCKSPHCEVQILTSGSSRDSALERSFRMSSKGPLPSKKGSDSPGSNAKNHENKCVQYHHRSPHSSPGRQYHSFSPSHPRRSFSPGQITFSQSPSPQNTYVPQASSTCTQKKNSHCRRSLSSHMRSQSPSPTCSRCNLLTSPCSLSHSPRCRHRQPSPSPSHSQQHKSPSPAPCCRHRHPSVSPYQNRASPGETVLSPTRCCRHRQTLQSPSRSRSRMLSTSPCIRGRHFSQSPLPQLPYVTPSTRQSTPSSSPDTASLLDDLAETLNTITFDGDQISVVLNNQERKT